MDEETIQSKDPPSRNQTGIPGKRTDSFTPQNQGTANDGGYG